MLKLKQKQTEIHWDISKLSFQWFLIPRCLWTTTNNSEFHLGSCSCFIGMQSMQTPHPIYGPSENGGLTHQIGGEYLSSKLAVAMAHYHPGHGNEPDHIVFLGDRTKCHGRPYSVDAVQGSVFAGIRAVEELDGVGVERESLEHLDRLLWENVLQVKYVDDNVNQGARSNKRTEEQDHTNHAPVTWLKRYLTEMWQLLELDLTRVFVCVAIIGEQWIGTSSSAVWQFSETICAEKRDHYRFLQK